MGQREEYEERERLRRRRDTQRLGQREQYEERDGRRRETLRLGQREEYEEREMGGGGGRH